MKAQLKMYPAVLAALMIGGAFFYVNSLTQRQTVGWVTLQGSISELQKLEKELDGEVLQSSFFLYNNYDRVNELLDRLEAQLAQTRQRYREVNAGPHPVAADLFTGYETAFAAKKAGVSQFLTANSTIKNSSLYLPVLMRKYIEGRQVDPLYLDRLAAIASSVYLAKNSLDRELVAELAKAVAPLQAVAPTDPRLLALHRAFVSHLRVFIDYFPRYANGLAAILAPTTAETLGELRQHVTSEEQEWLTRLNLITVPFLLAFLASLALIVVLLFKTGRENLKLLALQKALTESATTDRLTGLPNRFAFDSDLGSYRRPLLFLVNIDDFKHINGIYGVRVGDFLLGAVAARLSEALMISASARLYRLGGDDFGILTEDIPGSGKDLFAQSLLELIENVCFSYQEQAITVTISLGVSDQPPLLETADLALQEVKKNSRWKYLIFSESLNIQAGIAANLKTLTSIRHALENDGVLLYFQPIVDNRSGAVVKYECLMRLRTEAGAILAPGAFLDLTKESPLYQSLTMAMISKSFQAFRDNDCEFSVNLAVADILDQGVHEFILARLDEEPDLARRLTFEILESEGVENYAAMHAFIRQVKARGSKIAVDDFGAGYSNFSHILKLQVDILKIDASLIKDLDTDHNARTLVRTIVDFCRALRIQTVAEYVHSAPVHQVVCELGIDYTQGYHLGRPEAELPRLCRGGAAAGMNPALLSA